MDANKLQVLRDIPYNIPRVCGLCCHGEFPNNDWGTCSRHEYQHRKHTGSPRQLSILRLGSCPSFEESPEKVAGLGAYQEFLLPL